ncbi:MAG TPA: VOC family protein [Gemmatimonadaceae bacterium]|nr:VOC family protein [Gemmatimonadaceae bacterium]
MTGHVGSRIHSSVPTFLVSDVGATARWYVRRLGFEFGGTFPKTEPYAYASIHIGQAEIMFLNLDGYEKPDLSAQRPTGLWDAYIRMDGVRPMFQRVQHEPFIQSPLQRRPYGDWEFEVRDPNGYVLVFGGAP